MPSLPIFSRAIPPTLPASAVLLALTGLFICGLPGLLVGCSTAPTRAVSPDNSKSIASSTLHMNAKPELVLERLSWGINPSSAQQVRLIGTQAYVLQQLQLAPMTNAPAMPQAIQDQIAALSISQKSLATTMAELEQLRLASDADGAKEDAKKNYQQELNRLDKEAQTRAILRALYSPQQLQEQLSWFWFNHFNVFQGKANIRAMLGDYVSKRFARMCSAISAIYWSLPRIIQPCCVTSITSRTPSTIRMKTMPVKLWSCTAWASMAAIASVMCRNWGGY